MALDCASCHDPHGNTNYRIINATINSVAVAVAQVDEASKDYDTEQWSTGQSSMCAACHTEYHKTAAGQGSILDNGTYTHRVDMSYSYGGNVNPETVGFGGLNLPLAETGTNNRVVCQTCHLPHGTTATMTALATGPITGDSALLRLNNRGVCEVCHQK
jgi:formate-dependent nitrite reductase cytochrome c552 subunit